MPSASMSSSWTPAVTTATLPRDAASFSATPLAIGSSLWGGMVSTEHEADHFVAPPVAGYGCASTTQPTWGRSPPPMATTTSSPTIAVRASR